MKFDILHTKLVVSLFEKACMGVLFQTIAVCNKAFCFKITHDHCTFTRTQLPLFSLLINKLLGIPTSKTVNTQLDSSRYCCN